MSELKNIIEEAFERRADITPRNVETHISDAVTQAVNLLDSGEARVAEKVDGVGSGLDPDILRNRRQEACSSSSCSGTESMVHGFRSPC